jgi:hypothetical protein
LLTNICRRDDQDQLEGVGADMLVAIAAGVENPEVLIEGVLPLLRNVGPLNLNCQHI